MAKQDWLDYFDLLGKLADTLEELAVLQEEKTVCVNKGNLPKIDEIMKKEQAFSMTLRGYEQKRLKTLALLAVPPGPVGDLHKSMPMEVRVQGKKVVENLQGKYAHYRETADIAKGTLEAHLEQLEEITGTISNYAPPKMKGARSLETEGVLPKVVPGNVPLNLRQFQTPVADTKIVHPVSQEKLIETQKAQEVAEQSEVAGGDTTSALRQLAQQEEKNRISALQKKTLQENAEGRRD